MHSRRPCVRRFRTHRTSSSSFEILRDHWPSLNHLPPAPCTPAFNQAFDPKKFNFTKADEKELLLQFESCEGRGRVDNVRTTYLEKAVVKGSPNVVVINVSPIEYGHGEAAAHARPPARA